MQPFLSIILPTHERPKLLERALISIKSQASSISYEVIVISDVIDHATDDVCSRLLSRSDAYVRRNGDPGPAESRNLGLKLASGLTVLFLDDDDAFHPEFFSELAVKGAMRWECPIYMDCSIVKEIRDPADHRILSEDVFRTGGVLTEDVYVKNQLPFSCFIFPRILLQDIQFDCDMKAYEDWEFLLAVFRRGIAIHVPILGPRIFQVDHGITDRRGSSESATNLKAIFDYLLVYRRYPAPHDSLKRKRAELLAMVGFIVDASLL